MRIYVIEDDDMIRLALDRSLRRADVQVRQFAEPLTAIEAAKSETVDLVISDYSLPGLDGVRTLEAIRKLHPIVRTVILSGNSPDETLSRAMKERLVDRYLAKPWRQTELRNLIEELTRVSSGGS